MSWERALANAVVTDEGHEWLSELLWSLDRKYSAEHLERFGFPALMGGAERFPIEGLDYRLDVIPRAVQAAPTTLYLMAFSSQTPTTVPSADSVLATGTGTSPPVEASGGGYARPSLANTLWPAPTTVGAGRRTKVADPGVSFPESTGAYAAIDLNGFGLVTAVTAGKAIFYSNWLDAAGNPTGAAFRINQAGIQLRVPPFWQDDE